MGGAESGTCRSSLDVPSPGCFAKGPRPQPATSGLRAGLGPRGRKESGWDMVQVTDPTSRGRP